MDEEQQKYFDKIMDMYHNRPFKVEPVDKDYRGESWRILFPDKREALLIFTKAGFYRGGHSHSRPETSLILSGKVKSWKIPLLFSIKPTAGQPGIFLPSNMYVPNPLASEEIVREISAGEIMHNEAGEPHVTLALTDYWLLDFKINSKIGEWTNTNYPPYRRLVDEQFKK